MFKIIVADGKQELPDDDIYYIVAKEGIFIKKKLGIMDSVSPVKNISILESVKATAKMNIEKIPSIAVAKISNFFRAVQEEHRSEAIVLLFYNEKTKKYKIVPPSQKVSPASIDYNRSIVIDGWSMIGDVHSHSSMSAFHSGTDQGDEESFDGLHITFGNMNSEFISISASIVSNGNRVMVNPEEYMKGVELKEEIDEVEQIPTTRIYKWENGKMIEQTPKYKAKSFKTFRKYDKRYKIISENAIKAKTPPSWLDAVEYGFTYGHYNFGQAWENWEHIYQRSHPGQRGWNRNFDPTIWSQNKKPNNIVPPQNVGVNVKPLTFPPHDQGPVITDITTPDKPIPCETCAFKERAMEYIAKLLVEQNQGKIEEYKNDLDEKETYECEKCNIIVSFEYDMYGQIMEEIICPSCKSDNHLTLLDIMDEDDQYVGPYDFDHKLPDQKEDDRINCKTCGSVFDSSLLQKGDDGGSCPFCGTLIFVKQEVNYIEESKDKNVESINKEGIDDYKAEKENPNPSNIIPDPQQRISPLQWMFERFGGKT